MSAPDAIVFAYGDAVPPRFDSHPHGLALLPHGTTIAEVGDPGQRFAGIFLVDADCAAVAMNDAALDRYIQAKTPVFVYVTRPRDLRPFLRRAKQFRRRGITLEVMPGRS